MPINMVDAVEFNRIPSLNFVLPVVTSDPTGLTAIDEGRFIYNTTTDQVKYCNGALAWVALGPAGAGGPPTGSANGIDISGGYPDSLVVVTNAITNAKLADMAANTIKGNNTGATADPKDLTVADVKTLLAITNVDNTSDANKPVSTPQSTALGLKADKTTAITAGGGLTGDGTLASAVTLAVGQGTGITVNANDVALNTTYTNGLYLQLATGGTLAGYLTLHADPDSDMKAATKRYVDLVSQGYSGKNAVRAVATTNVTQSGTQTIDGVALIANQRVLCAGQTTPSQNGIWVVAAGAWTRAVDMDASGELVDGTVVPVAEGTSWGDSLFICTATTASPWVPNSSGSTWTRQSGLADLQVSTGITKAGNTISLDTSYTDDRYINVSGDTGIGTLVLQNTATLQADQIAAATVATDVAFFDNIDMVGSKIKNLGTPSVNTDATTKLYVDSYRRYQQDLGAITGGSGLVVTHNLNTRDLHVAVYRTTTPWDVVQCGVEMTSTTTVTLRFALSYSASTFRVVITG